MDAERAAELREAKHVRRCVWPGCGTPRIRADVIAELHRCSATRRDRQEDLIEALVRVDALDRRIADLVDELALHEGAPA